MVTKKTAEELYEKLEELIWEKRQLINMQGKCSYDSPTYKDLEKDIIATEKLVDKIKNKLMIKADPTKTTHAPSSQSELIKKHNKNIRKTKKKMLKVKGGY